MAKLESLDSKVLQKLENLANCYRHADKALDRLNEAFNIMQPNIHADYPMKKEDAITVFSALESGESYVLDNYYDYKEKIMKLLPKKDTWYWSNNCWLVNSFIILLCNLLVSCNCQGKCFLTFP